MQKTCTKKLNVTKDIWVGKIRVKCTSGPQTCAHVSSRSTNSKSVSSRSLIVVRVSLQVRTGLNRAPRRRGMLVWHSSPHHAAPSPFWHSSPPFFSLQQPPLLCPAAPLLLHVRRHPRQHRQSFTARDPLRPWWWHPSSSACGEAGPAASACGGRLLLLVVVVHGWRQSRDTVDELGPWR
jgi:hypothetical protein